MVLAIWPKPKGGIHHIIVGQSQAVHCGYTYQEKVKFFLCRLVDYMIHCNIQVFIDFEKWFDSVNWRFFFFSKPPVDGSEFSMKVVLVMFLNKNDIIGYLI